MDEVPQDGADAAPSEYPTDPRAVAMEGVAMSRYPRTGRTGVTVETMLGGSEPISGIASVGGAYPCRHHVLDGSVMTSSQLTAYMHANQVEARNGRLESQELAPAIAALFVVEVLLGIASRFAPQANGFLLGIPAEIATALASVSAVLLLVPETMDGALNIIRDSLRDVLGYLT